MNKFKINFTIPYYEVDKSRKLTPVSLLEYLGEASSAHSDYLGMGFDKLRENNYGWMLKNWKARFDIFPSVKEQITIETWTSSFDKFYANREFIIYNNENREIGRATTLWIFLDIVRKRPIRIPKEFDEIYNIIEEKAFKNFSSIDQEFSSNKSMEFNVRKSDIDYNEHVNNTKYLSWIIENIPSYIEENYSLYELEILYKKEILYGKSIMVSNSEEIQLDNVIETFHKIVESGSNDVNTWAKTIWKLKSV